ncbi:MAG: FAD-dependent oxidoreductase, partial [Planctomycetes bacterium]|nr:FAD-dependent oxidoreductase [Planctomycetota bacterium]
KTAGKALWSPSTASADPVSVIHAMAADAQAAGIEVRRGVACTGIDAAGVRTSAGTIAAGYTVNCAGLYADQLARAVGLCERYTILPFKGLYLYSSEPAGALRTNIYPVPDLAYPFLGVHYTVTVDGHIKIGPTALPAFWRENYGGFARFSLSELLAICGREASLFLHAGFDFRGLAMQELRKMFRGYLVDQAAKLIDGVRRQDYVEWGRPGIRAQLLDLRTRTLVMDFRLEGDARSFHVLNAVSPAWTCSLPFARHVCDEIAKAGGPGIGS